VSWRAVWSAKALAAMAACLSTAASPAWSQTKLDARYVVTLAGIPIGKGAWVVDIAETQFTAAASGGTAGLLSVFAGGRGQGASHGSVNGGKFVPGSFGATITSEKHTRDVRMTMAGGDVKDYELTPADPPDPPFSERIPLTEEHRRGASDPLS